MHIVHIYKDYFPVLGGMENHIKIISEGLVDRGHRVTVLVSNTQNETVVEQRAGVMVIKAAQWLRRASTPISPMMWLKHLNLAPDILHLHHPFPPGDLLYWVQKPRSRPPLVITHHSDIVRQKKLLTLYSPLLKQTLHAAKRIIATSPQYIQSSPWLKPHAQKCTVIPLSVDTHHFTQPNTAQVTKIQATYGDNLMLFVGRLRYYKGLHFLLEALPAINSSAKLLIVGIGSEEQYLRQQAAALGVTERIIWAGEVADQDLPDYYAAAQMFVLPAHLRSEAFGIVQLEALAAGLPIVSTELGTGTSFVNQHNQTGFVVPPADPPALARAINVLLANPELRHYFAAQGQIRARTEFTPELMLDRIEHVYQEVRR